jgi:hypothetical protein
MSDRASKQLAPLDSPSKTGLAKFFLLFLEPQVHLSTVIPTCDGSRCNLAAPTIPPQQWLEFDFYEWQGSQTVSTLGFSIKNWVGKMFLLLLEPQICLSKAIPTFHDRRCHSDTPMTPSLQWPELDFEAWQGSQRVSTIGFSIKNWVGNIVFTDFGVTNVFRQHSITLTKLCCR